MHLANKLPWTLRASIVPFAEMNGVVRLEVVCSTKTFSTQLKQNNQVLI